MSVITSDEAYSLALRLEQVGASHLIDGEMDQILSTVMAEGDLQLVVDAVEPSIDGAGALYRASLKRTPNLQAHAHWLLAGAYSLGGLDDVPTRSSRSSRRRDS